MDIDRASIRFILIQESLQNVLWHAKMNQLLPQVVAHYLHLLELSIDVIVAIFIHIILRDMVLERMERAGQIVKP